MSSPPIHVLVVESDPSVAREISALVVQAFLPRTTTLLATTASASDARRLIDEFARHKDATLLAICASRLADGESGLRILELARMRHPRALGVVITSGQRDELVEALRRGVVGILERPIAADALRDVIRCLGDEARSRSLPVQLDVPVAAVAADDVRDCVAALERAIDEVETAQLALRRARGAASARAQETLAQAERLAAEAHRRVLDAQRAMHAGPAA